MNLWIRSQNKTILAKVNKIEIKKDHDKYAIVSERFIDDDYREDVYVCLGKYKERKRALEVLDEIQDFLWNDYRNEVYEMPEDEKK